ncbi:hypothetical protein RsS93_22390 [Rhizobium dioscoreae]|uniref:Uncharacterized protein n=1 Tax=Rhizobium dioscoreae TaxID=2653122 RepID=A0ABQ0Z2B2_9HYPH|nr:hypothetical protein RsS93_22390 [Rhizobium dioscoreae]
MNEPRTKALFKSRDKLADGGRCHPAGRGSGSEATELHGAHEDFHFTRTIGLLAAHDEFKS